MLVASFFQSCGAHTTQLSPYAGLSHDCLYIWRIFCVWQINVNSSLFGFFQAVSHQSPDQWVVPLLQSVKILFQTVIWNFDRSSSLQKYNLISHKTLQRGLSSPTQKLKSQEDDDKLSLNSFSLSTPEPTALYARDPAMTSTSKSSW